ncbi:MAG TPA: urease accessory protein UreE [Vicinamibacterales bacterium]|nr:urease accessory protein UreE [Vicinamibacterales bacterium]
MFFVTVLYREPELPASIRDYERDTLTLGWEDRLQAHGRRRSDGGIELAISLPRGSVLRAGDCLVLDERRLVVVVIERAEPVFVIHPRSAPEWALYAYHIGNRHQPVMITESAIVCPDVPGMEQLLHQQHIPHTRALLPFTPATAAAGHHH